MKRNFIRFIILVTVAQCEIYEVNDYCKIEEYYMLDGIELRKCYR